MKRYKVVFADLANADISGIWAHVAREKSVQVADRFAETIIRDCLDLEYAPARGISLVPQRPNVRAIGAAKKRVTLIFRLGDDEVEILRVHYKGKNHRFA